MSFKNILTESTRDDENNTKQLIVSISDAIDKLDDLMKKYKSPLASKTKKDFTIALSNANDFFNTEFGAEK